ERAVGSSSPSSPGERTYYREVNGVLHLRLVLSLVLDPGPPSRTSLIDRVWAHTLDHQTLAAICDCLLHELIQLFSALHYHLAGETQPVLRSDQFLQGFTTFGIWLASVVSSIGEYNVEGKECHGNFFDRLLKLVLATSPL